MTPHKQKYKHDPENGIYGDCFRTSVACLLDVDPEEVPHSHRPDETGRRQNEVMRGYLSTKGYGLAVIPFYSTATASAEEAATLFSHFCPDQPYLLGGETGDGVGHVVICNGGEVIHNTGANDVVGPTRPELCYWLHLVTKL